MQGSGLATDFTQLLALSLFTFGTLLCGMAPTMGTLIAARTIAGMGGGGSVSSHNFQIPY
jgi:predicted MFS family arabinose efflux permease